MVLANAGENSDGGAVRAGLAYRLVAGPQGHALDHQGLAAARDPVMKLLGNDRCWRPWETIVVFAFAPLPYDPAGVLAPSTNYPLGKYVTVNVTGRVFLYYLLALEGAWLPIPPTYFISIVIFVTLMPLLCVSLVKRRFEKRRL